MHLMGALITWNRMATSKELYDSSVPKKIGLILVPPSIVLIYKNQKTNKLRKRVMPVRGFKQKSNLTFLAEDLVARHRPLLNEVDIGKVQKMLFVLQKHKTGVDLDEALKMAKMQTFHAAENDLLRLGSGSIGERIAAANSEDDSDAVDDPSADIYFDDLEAPIDKLGIYSDEETDAFWK
ncbi:centrosomal protein of 19 kDa-like isoform X2 [Nilaparvata lugens]|uniref:centrosomal protein of 19 kDa-like isoform X2 n=1 Tax=Nilaparvata lugens TaxID=108931 RepID=UPI00193C96CF|nr:centrosomal protein of 19 kDa-like isoform X2 [Nilaparvata lugens]